MDCMRKLGFVHLGGTQIKFAIRNCIVVAGSALEKYVGFFFSNLHNVFFWAHEEIFNEKLA